MMCNFFVYDKRPNRCDHIARGNAVDAHTNGHSDADQDPNADPNGHRLPHPDSDPRPGPDVTTTPLDSQID